MLWKGPHVFSGKGEDGYNSRIEDEDDLNAIPTLTVQAGNGGGVAINTDLLSPEELSLEIWPDEEEVD